MIRFPFIAMVHGLPMGIKFAFSTAQYDPAGTGRSKLPGLAEIVRKNGPMGLENVEIDDPFLAKGARFIADGYDADFIRDNL